MEEEVAKMTRIEVETNQNLEGENK